MWTNDNQYFAKYWDRSCLNSGGDRVEAWRPMTGTGTNL